MKVFYSTTRRLLICFALLAAAILPAQERPQRLYVPFKDISAALNHLDKAMLMDRTRFEALLAAARRNAAAATSAQQVYIRQATYTGAIKGDNLVLDATFSIASDSAGPLPLPLPFADLAISKIDLDGKPAPLNYNRGGRLILVVAGKGDHQLTVIGATRLNELKRGGMRAAISIPPAVAGTMTLTLPGDQEAHANVPITATRHEQSTDQTTVRLALGGHANLSLALMGNGRQEDDNAILLGESATTVALTPTGQEMNCLFTVRVLRRGLRELKLQLPQAWTVSDVTCPSLVRWAVSTRDNAKLLTIRLRNAERGTRALHIKAYAPNPNTQWRFPHVSLVNADYQRGFLLVAPGVQLMVRSERLTNTRRQDIKTASRVSGLTGTSGRLYFHWGDNPQVLLGMAAVELQRHTKERQEIVVTPDGLVLNLHAQISAVGKEMFHLNFQIPPAETGWQLEEIRVNGRHRGFEHRTTAIRDGRQLRVELGRPIAREGAAKVLVKLKHTPENWNWSSLRIDNLKPRPLRVPLVRTQAAKTKGQVAVRAIGDLRIASADAADRLTPVKVGRMAALQLTADVQHAWEYKTGGIDGVTVTVDRLLPRFEADSIGLADIGTNSLQSDFVLTYRVSRAATRTLYLLADKVLGENLNIQAVGQRLTSTHRVAPGPTTAAVPSSIANSYNLWELRFDGRVRDQIAVYVNYTLPRQRPKTRSNYVPIPLIRPAGVPRADEMLAVQAREQLAVDLKPTQAEEIDQLELPTLPAKPKRILGAYRLKNGTAPMPQISFVTTSQQGYGVPVAVAMSAELTTAIGANGSQQVKAVYNITNAGHQFITIRLPPEAQLWSARVGTKQAKPKTDDQGTVQLAMPYTTKPMPVAVVFYCPPGKEGLDEFVPTAPTLINVDVRHTTWRVYAPPDFRVVNNETDASIDGIIRPRPIASLFAGSFMVMGMGRNMEPNSAQYLSDTAAPPQAPAGATGESYESAAKADKSFFGSKKSKKSLTGWSQDYQAQGRYTLPVELTVSPNAAPPIICRSIGTPAMVLEIRSQRRGASRFLFGMIISLILAVGFRRASAGAVGTFILTVLFTSSFLAVWFDGLVNFCNGLFAGALLVAGLLAAVGIIRIVKRAYRSGSAKPVSVAMALLLLICVVEAGDKAPAKKRVTRQTKAVKNPLPPPRPPHADPPGKVVVPYSGKPDAKAANVIVPYEDYVRLWNLAHPEKQIQALPDGTSISMANVNYDAELVNKKLGITLRTNITSRGTGWLSIPMPVGGMALTAATLNGQPARLQRGPQGTSILLLKAGEKGELILQATAVPQLTGRKGSIELDLPPLPLGIMRLQLNDPELEVEANGAPAALARQQVGNRTQWLLPLGNRHKLQLSWSPRAGTGAADRTLTAASRHSVYAFHWALIGISRFTFAFSAGQNDRFEIYVPAAAEITQVSGVNLRDTRIMGRREIEGQPFKIVSIRLHRPAEKRCDLTVRWVAELPPLAKPSRLWLPRAGGVGRESGSVALFRAGGITIRGVKAVGGRRVNTKAAKTVGKAADLVYPVAGYAWPYREFSLTWQLARLPSKPAVAADQLVRISQDRVQILAHAKLKAERGQIFGVSFLLPTGYELLSALGPQVEDWYIQREGGKTYLHVALRAAADETTVALIMVNDQPKLGQFTVPAVKVVDADHRLIAKQGGRFAVQVAPALEARTVASQGLKPVPPKALNTWLDSRQRQAIQFAYVYEKPDVQLALGVRQLSAKVRVESLAGIAIRPTKATYTYRLRFRIDGSPIDRVSFSLPKQYAERIAVTSNAMRSAKQRSLGDDRQEWTVSLISEVTGVLDLAVNFTLPIDAKTTTLPVPRLSTSAPAGYRAIVAVQNQSRHDIQFQPSAGLRPLSVAEQNSILTGAVRSHLHHVYHAFRDDWSASLKISPAKPAGRLQAVIDLMAVTTTVDRSGMMQYDVKLSIHNRSEQFLEFATPAGFKLWRAVVAGKTVKPVISSGAAAGTVLVPLVKTSASGMPYAIRLTLVGNSSTRISGTTRIAPPRLGIKNIPIRHTTWTLLLPREYSYTWRRGNMSPIAGAAELMTFGVEAKLSQLGRLVKSYQTWDYKSAKSRNAAAGNMRQVGVSLLDDLQANRELLEQRRHELGEEEYDRLRRKLDAQERTQLGYVQSLQQADKQARQQTDINQFLNGIPNVGLSELTRNAVLNDIPTFAQQARQRQLRNIRTEIQVTQRSLKDVTAGKTLQTRKAPTNADLVVVDEDKSKEMQGIVKELAKEQSARLEERGRRLKQQLDNLRENRAGRYYGSMQQRGSAGNQPQGQTSQQRQRQAQEGERMAEIQWNWIDARKQPKAIPRESSESSLSLQQKIKSIVITKISFEDTPVSTVFDFLKTRSRELDPEGVGVNFLVMLRSGAGSQPQAAPPGNDDDDDDAWGDHDAWGDDDDDDAGIAANDLLKEPTITMDFDNIPLAEAIRYICEGAGLTYKMEEHAIIILGPSVARASLELRIFRISDETFRFTGNTDRFDVKRFFETKGVSFSPPATIAYHRPSGKLVVSNTPENNRLVEQILRQLGGLEGVVDTSKALREAPRETSEAAFGIRQKLKSIIITKVSFEDTPVTTIFDFLKTRSRELDPEGVGVNFLVILKSYAGGNASEPAAPAFADDGDAWGDDDDDAWGDDDDDAWGDDDDDAWGDDDDDDDGEIMDDNDNNHAFAADLAEPTATLDFDNIPLSEVIRYVCEAAGLKYKVEEHAVVILGPGVSRGQLELRFFAIDPRLYASGGDDDDSDDVGVDFQRYFEQLGVTFPTTDTGAGASISYDRGTGKLIVRNTPENLRLMEIILRELSGRKTRSDDEDKETVVPSPYLQMRTSTYTRQPHAALPRERGYTRLDFYYPGGDEAEVSVLAVPQSSLGTLKRTVLLLVALAAVLGLRIAHRKLKRRNQ